MLNLSARKAGLPINSTSLLNYIGNNKSSTANSLLNALSNSSNLNTSSKSQYEQLEKSADALESSASVLTSEKEDNIFELAREEGNTNDVKKQTNEFISNYNTLMKKLISSGTTSSLNYYYKQMLKEVYTDNKESLGNIGISAESNGFLSMDDDKFKTSDIDTLEEALGKDSSFTTKTEYIAGRVSNNAETNLESISSQYSTSGQSYSAYLSSKYNISL
jgi:cell division protein FtsB